MDYITGRKPSLIGSVNGIIAGLVAITPGAGFVNGWGAMAIGVIATVVVYLAYNYLSRMRPFRNVDDTLGVVYTHGFAGRHRRPAGRCLRRSAMLTAFALRRQRGSSFGGGGSNCSSGSSWRRCG